MSTLIQSISALSSRPLCLDHVCLDLVCLDPVCLYPVCLDPVCLDPVYLDFRFSLGFPRAPMIFPVKTNPPGPPDLSKQPRTLRNDQNLSVCRSVGRSVYLIRAL